MTFCTLSKTHLFTRVWRFGTRDYTKEMLSVGVKNRDRKTTWIEEVPRSHFSVARVPVGFDRSTKSDCLNRRLTHYATEIRKMSRGLEERIF
jgi:hypothetical protein